MPKYSEVLSFEQILNIVKDKYSSVLIIGCGGCMNESLALKNGDWIFDKKQSIYTAVALECSKISTMLGEQGIKCVYHIYSACIRNYQEETSVKNINLSDVDAILIMSCLDGFDGLNEILGDYKVPTYQISRWKGFLYYKYKETEEYRCIVEGKVVYF